MSEPGRVDIVRIELDEDGTSVEIPYETVAAAPDEPHVRGRRQVAQDGVVSEVVTEYSAAGECPASYPAHLPFLAGRAVWTTESPDGSVSTGARWLCGDPDGVIASVIAASEAADWKQLADTPEALVALAPTAVLRRANVMRAVLRTDDDDFHIVQLMDVKDL